MVSLERLIRMRGFRLFRTFRRSLRVVGTLAVGHLSVRRGRSLSTSLILAECILRLRLRRCCLVGRTFRRTWLVGLRAVTRPRPWHRWAATCSRSEEHTSELQSRENLVCRLLLEKKKSTKKK